MGKLDGARPLRSKLWRGIAPLRREICRGEHSTGRARHGASWTVCILCSWTATVTPFAAGSIVIP